MTKSELIEKYQKLMKEADEKYQVYAKERMKCRTLGNESGVLFFGKQMAKQMAKSELLEQILIDIINIII